MKNIFCYFLVLTSMLVAEPPIPEIPPAVKEPKTQMPYCSFGGCGPIIVPISPEVALGIRKINTRHGWDAQVGASVLLQYGWVQTSYLYYFETNKEKTPYLGVGLTGIFTPQAINFLPFGTRGGPAFFPNIPFTLGYQWNKKEESRFCQIQFTPFLISTISYGVGY
jgi:hypothetical protein